MAGWSLSLYPAAGEAGGSFVPTIVRRGECVARGEARDPERAALEAGRRAKAKLRRYCAANRLNRLGTLTYRGEGCHDPKIVRADLANFFRALRDATGGDALPYLWVPEWHKTGHGLHVHFAIGRYIPRRHIVESWPHGVVHIKLIGDVPVGTGALGESRKAAGYLSKYVAKTFTDTGARVPGLQRYDVAQGFTPEKVTLTGRSDDAVLAAASEHLGCAPQYVWNSREVANWTGPPAIWAQWGQ